METFLLLSAGLAMRSSQLTIKKPRSPFRLVLAVALVESKFCFPHAFLSDSVLKAMKKSLAYLEMRLILARMLWSFDLKLTAESQDWDDQKSWIQWDKKPLMVNLSLVAKQ